MPKFKPNAYGEFVSEFRKAKALENISYPTFDAAAKDAAPIWEVTCHIQFINNII